MDILSIEDRKDGTCVLHYVPTVIPDGSIGQGRSEAYQLFHCRESMDMFRELDKSRIRIHELENDMANLVNEISEMRSRRGSVRNVIRAWFKF